MTPVLLLGVLLGAASVKVDKISYHGWPDAYRMSNGIVDLVYVPQIGRIMRFGRSGGLNVLWENSRLSGKTSASAKSGQWANYGGDKLWPAPQKLWNWPPDPGLDGASYNVRVFGSGLEISGGSGKFPQVRFIRSISMDPGSSTIRITNRMVNTSSVPEELAIWEIAQTDDPEKVTVPLQITRDMPNGWAPYEGFPSDPAFATVEDGALVVRRDPKSGFKVASGAEKGLLTAFKKGSRFTMSARKTSGTYVDNGKFLAVYGNGDPDKYMELEITGPLTRLAPGQDTSLVVTWRIE